MVLAGLFAGSQPHRGSLQYKIKAYLRKVGADGKKGLMEAMGQALRIVTPRDAAGWLAHCGYRFRGQPS